MQQLKGDSRPMHGALSLMCANGFTEMNRPHCVLNKFGCLWHNAKSTFKLALTRQFFPDVGESTPWLCQRGATVSGSTVKRNSLVYATSEVSKIDVYVHDGPFQIRRARPHTSTLVNQTGFGQIVDLLAQFCGADLSEGVTESHFGFDAGGCLQKKWRKILGANKIQRRVLSQYPSPPVTLAVRPQRTCKACSLIVHLVVVDRKSRRWQVN